MIYISFTIPQDPGNFFSVGKPMDSHTRFRFLTCVRWPIEYDRTIVTPTYYHPASFSRSTESAHYDTPRNSYQFTFNIFHC